MIPLIDVHCHLCAGLDDGPRTDEEALEMCRLAWHEGVRSVAATAHQNDDWPEVTPAAIRWATKRLAKQLRDADLPLTVVPCAEVMIGPDLVQQWRDGHLLSVGDRGKYLLVELPHGLFLDLRDLFRDLGELGVRPVLAHPERHDELLYGNGTIDELIALGALVQVSSGSLIQQQSRERTKALRSWVRRGIVHLIGSDGHRPLRRPPRMAEAYRRVVEWAGDSTADRICYSNALAVLQGLPLKLPRPRSAKRRLFWYF